MGPKRQAAKESGLKWEMTRCIILEQNDKILVVYPSKCVMRITKCCPPVHASYMDKCKADASTDEATPFKFGNFKNRKGIRSKAWMSQWPC